MELTVTQKSAARQEHTAAAREMLLETIRRRRRYGKIGLVFYCVGKIWIEENTTWSIICGKIPV